MAKAKKDRVDEVLEAVEEVKKEFKVEKLSDIPVGLRVDAPKISVEQK